MWESIFPKLLSVFNFVPYLILLYDVCSRKIEIADFILITGAMSSMGDVLFWKGFYEIDRIKDFLRKVGFLKKFFELPVEESKIMNEKKTDSERTSEENPLISFENVSFAYDDKKVLKDLSFQICEGEKVAILGENGAGKSTILQLLLRFYMPQDGAVKWRGREIGKIELEEYRKQFCVLFQNCGHYAFDFHENVALDTMISEDAIKQLAEKLHISDIYQDSKQGLNTELTKKFSDEGKEVSTGQWKKISIMRTLLSDRAVMLLDEPTASLDLESEKAFWEFVFSNNRKTTLIVTHQLLTSIRCDKILFIGNDDTWEFGSPQELLSDKSSKFYKMFHAQELKFEDITAF